MLKRILILTLAAPPAALYAEQAPTALSTEARGLAKQLGSTLKGELQSALQSAGPLEAITVCHVRAPGIASELSVDGWTVGRTSLRPRNRDNAPEPWETAVMTRFESRKQAGEDPKSIEYSEIVTVDGVETFRYMKAIPTAGICVTCHGAELTPALDARILELYPDDQARGFKPGDLRGAFTIQKTGAGVPTDG